MLKKMLCFMGVLLLCGCSKQSVAQNNVDKIRIDMTMAQVNKLLGKPNDQQTFTIVGKKTTAAVWKHPKGTILVTFANDKVSAKEFRKNR